MNSEVLLFPNDLLSTTLTCGLKANAEGPSMIRRRMWYGPVRSGRRWTLDVGGMGEWVLCAQPTVLRRVIVRSSSY